ncbi:MAG: TIR domain-containing protein [Thermoanaerobaculia bacterium]
MGLPKVLLADKDRNLRRKWARDLKAKGFEVEEVATFAEAWEKSGDQPDIAVIDFQLSQEVGNPRLVGRAIRPDIPTIIIMDAPTSDLIRDCFRRMPGYPEPAADVIGKAEGITALVAAIRRALTPRVFVAHGHDLGAKEEVVRLLRAFKLRPVVLSEEADSGRTIIEKIEDYSDVAFSIVLLTPDDIGGTNLNDLTPRARQNVIFELGYFFAKLGRRKVVALSKKKGDQKIEVPSNYSGILYLEMDPTRGWKMRLAEEMAAAGFEIDFNQVLGP